jgi:hypothetical protein
MEFVLWQKMERMTFRLHRDELEILDEIRSDADDVKAAFSYTSSGAYNSIFSPMLPKILFHECLLGAIDF